MKTLQESLFDSETQTMESLFDKDIVNNSTVCLGELFELSTAPHHCSFSNEPEKIFKAFPKTAWRKIEKLPWKVDTTHSFIQYYKKDYPHVEHIIKLCYAIPLELIGTDMVENAERLGKWLKQYIGADDHNVMYISCRTIPGSAKADIASMIEVEFINGIRNYTPNRMILMFRRK